MMRTLLSRSRLIYLRDLLYEMVVRDMRLRYKRSVLGIAWSLVNPLAQMLVFTFIFQKLFTQEIDNYPVFVFVGVLAWSWFQASLVAAAGAITDNRELIKRPGFPTALLPIVAVTTQLVHYLLALPIIFAFILFGRGPIGVAFLFLPVVIFLQYGLSVGLGYILAAVNVRFRDTQHLLGVALMLWFYLTPIFYSYSLVPEAYRSIYNLNPLVHLVQAYRTIYLQAAFPAWQPLLVLLLFNLILLGGGYALFRKASVRFVEEL